MPQSHTDIALYVKVTKSHVYELFLCKQEPTEQWIYVKEKCRSCTAHLHYDLLTEAVKCLLNGLFYCNCQGLKKPFITLMNTLC